MTNKEFLENIGLKNLTGSSFDDNVKAISFLKINDKTPIIVEYEENNSNKSTITISPADTDHAFISPIWNNLTFDQKIRVLRWKQTEYFYSLVSPAKRLPHFKFFTDDKSMDNTSSSAFANSDFVFWNLNALNKMEGYEALDIILHETIHSADYACMDRLIKKYEQYLKYDSATNLTSSIIALPTEGRIYNYATKTFDTITPEMQDGILLLKNFFVTINTLKGTYDEKKLVVSRKSFDKYLQKMFYLNSPLEVRAFTGSYYGVLEIYKKNVEKFGIDASDEKTIKGIRDYVDLIHRKTSEIQKRLNLHIKTAVNLEFIAKYNELKGLEGKSQICPELMKIRDERVNLFYAKKFNGREIK